jgi:hypothetical protein
VPEDEASGMILNGFGFAGMSIWLTILLVMGN